MNFTEFVFEDATLDRLKELRYEFGHGPEIAPGKLAAERDALSHAVLFKPLRTALRKLNTMLPVESLDEAFRKIVIPHGTSLIMDNREFNRFLVNGIAAEFFVTHAAILARSGERFRLEQCRATVLSTKCRSSRGLDQCIPPFWRNNRDRRGGVSSSCRGAQSGHFVRPGLPSVSASKSRQKSRQSVGIRRQNIVRKANRDKNRDMASRFQAYLLECRGIPTLYKS